MTSKLKIMCAAAYVAVMFAFASADSSAEESIADRPCKRDSPWIMQCDTSDSFISYSCQHPDWPGCKENNKKAIETFSACLDTLHAADCWGLPMTNPYTETEDDRPDYDALKKGCKSSKGDACCGYAGYAEQCSSAILQAREAFYACKDRTDYVYKNNLPNSIKCGGCIPGKILQSETLCYNSDNASGAKQPNDAASGEAPKDKKTSPTLLEKFKEALIANRPKPEDFPPDVPGIRAGSDTDILVGNPIPPWGDSKNSEQYRLPDGTVAYEFKVKGRFQEERDYVVKLQEIVGNPTFVLPDGEILQAGYAQPGIAARIPAGTKIITSPDSQIVFRIAGDGYSNSVIVKMEGASEIELEKVFPQFAKLKAVKGFVRFQQQKVSLAPATQTWGKYVYKPTILSDTSESLGAPEWIIRLLSREAYEGGDVNIITKGTDFGVGYGEKGNPAVELYDGTVIVTHVDSGVSTTLSTAYGGDIKRVDVATGGTMTEKIAVPQNDWASFVAQNTKSQGMESKNSSGNKFFWFFASLVLLAAGGFFAYEKGLLAKYITRKEPVIKK